MDRLVDSRFSCNHSSLHDASLATRQPKEPENNQHEFSMHQFLLLFAAARHSAARGPSCRKTWCSWVELAQRMTDGIRGGPSGPLLAGVCAATILRMSHRSTPSRILIDRQLPVSIVSGGGKHFVGADTPDLHKSRSVLPFLEVEKYGHDIARITSIPSSPGFTDEL